MYFILISRIFIFNFKKGDDLQFGHMNIKTTNVESIDNDKVVIRDFEITSKYTLTWAHYVRFSHF